MSYAKKMEQMFSEKKYDELEKFCKERISLNPEDKEPIFFYASLLSNKNEYEKSIKLFTKLYNTTNDTFFLICSSIPCFLSGKKEEGTKILNLVAKKENKFENLFYAFRIATANGIVNTGSLILYRAYKKYPKKTIEKLRELFERDTREKVNKKMIASVLKMLEEFI